MSHLPPSLLGVYESRPIQPGDLAGLVKASARRPGRPDDLSQDYAALYGADLHERASQYQLLRQDRDVLSMVERQYRAGEIETFRFQGQRYAAADAKRMLKKLDRLLEEEDQWWADFDARVFRVHYRMASDLGEKFAKDLRLRYDFQLALQEVDREAGRQRRVLTKVAAFVNDNPGPLSYDDFHDVRTSLMAAYDAFYRCLSKACRVPPPKLVCLSEGQPLGNVLLSKAPVQPLRPVAQVLPARWINQFQRQVDEVRGNVRRVHHESLGALLKRQEWLARKWAEEMANLPEVEEAEIDVLDEVAEPSVELEPLYGEPEFELSEQDVLAEPEEAGGDVDVEEIDPDDHKTRPRYWRSEEKE